jgi:chromatin segregation and condensation protein Rec8/ScpA/Scc1 (kleisin family)
MTALYQLTDQYRQAAERLADLDLPDEVIADTLEGMAGELEVKATNVAAFARNLETTAAAIKDAEASMAARRKALERRAESLRHYLLHNMQRAGIRRIDSPHFTIAVKDNPPAVDVFDVLQLPAEFMRQPEPPPPSPDKAAIKEALKAGVEVPGARMKESQRLEVK